MTAFKLVYPIHWTVVEKHCMIYVFKADSASADKEFLDLDARTLRVFWWFYSIFKFFLCLITIAILFAFWFGGYYVTSSFLIYFIRSQGKLSIRTHGGKFSAKLQWVLSLVND